MEVHAHTHTARKKWTHYFWEFLMLFLAVFCGFLAENKREHYVEHHRANQYAKSLLADLRQDTAELRLGLIHSQFSIFCMDSLLATSPATAINETMPGAFYYYNAVMANSYRIDWNKSTLNQLVQSGSLRYFRNDLGDKISKYSVFQAGISGNNQVDVFYRDKIMEISSRILYSRYFTGLITLKPDVGSQVLPVEIDSLITSRLPIQPGSSKLIDALLNQVSIRRGKLTALVNSFYPKAIGYAIEIIDLLTEIYHVK